MVRADFTLIARYRQQKPPSSPASDTRALTASLRLVSPGSLSHSPQRGTLRCTCRPVNESSSRHLSIADGDPIEANEPIFILRPSLGLNKVGRDLRKSIKKKEKKFYLAERHGRCVTSCSVAPSASDHCPSVPTASTVVVSRPPGIHCRFDQHSDAVELAC